MRNLGYLELVREHLVAVNVGLCALVTLLAYATGYGYGISYAGVPRLSYLVPGGRFSLFSLVCLSYCSIRLGLIVVVVVVVGA